MQAMTYTMQRLPWRERAVVAAMLLIIVVLAWSYVAHLAAGMAGMDAARGIAMPAMQMAMPHAVAWRVEDAALTFLMWSVMMVAMMVPSATPMILTHAGLARLHSATAASLTTTAFLAGYLIVWVAFSAGATVLQWGFHSASLLSHALASDTPLLAGSLLVLAGAYQLTRWKQVCLTRCRTPLDFLMTEWREGPHGALLMGTRHGAYCVGCCWALMLLLFVAGVMNLLWVAVLAGYVLLEKLVPAVPAVSRLVGILALGWGAWLLGQALVT